MASKADTLMAAIGAPTLLDQHGETVTLTQGVTATSISAIVNRNGIEVTGGDGNIVAYPITVQVKRSDVTGLSVRSDKITLKSRVTDSSSTQYTIKQVLASDGGMWHLALS
jgi:hypothetical protein